MTTPTIGVIGADVPRQLILAAGATPVRLTGAWSGEVSQEAVDLLGAADAVAMRVLDGVLSGEQDGLVGLVVCNDSMAHLRIFYVLRVLAGRGRFPFRVHLLDTPRGGGKHRNRFVAQQYERVANFAASCTQTRAEDGTLAEAAAREVRLGQALDKVRALRRKHRLTGAVALRCHLAAAQRTPEDAVVEIEASLNASTCADTSLSAAQDGLQSAVPVFMTGSSHPDPTVYEALEAAGYLVVGDDHDTGDNSWIGDPVDASGRFSPQHIPALHAGTQESQNDPTQSQRWGAGLLVQDGDGGAAGNIYQSLAKLHARRPPAAARSLSSERTSHLLMAVEQSGATGVVALVRDLDDGPIWDLPDQRKAVVHSGRSLAAVVQIPADGTREATAALIAQVQSQEALS